MTVGLYLYIVDVLSKINGCVMIFYIVLHIADPYVQMYRQTKCPEKKILFFSFQATNSSDSLKVLISSAWW